MADAVRDLPPRKIPARTTTLRLSGLEPFTARPEIPFINIGERANVAGSKIFKKLILSEDYTAALSVARQQVEAGELVVVLEAIYGIARRHERHQRSAAWRSAGGKAGGKTIPAHIVTPSAAATVKISLSPRPHRLAMMI